MKQKKNRHSHRHQLPSPPEHSSRARWLFRILAATFIPLVVLAGVELVLRLAGYGYSTAFFREISADGKRLVVENDAFSRRFFPRNLARRPLPVSFSPEKPAGTYRVFVMGESAAMGDPEPAFSFGRILEVLLRERFPQGRFEVINTAFTAINSHVILPIAKACAQKQGDLWVIYMGHNEVQGPFGPGTVFGSHESRLWLTRAALAFKTTRVGQLAEAWRSRLGSEAARHPSWRGLEMFLQNQFRRDDPRLTSMYEQFRENLHDILAAARGRGVEVILCSAASNLKDSAPFASLHPPGFGQDLQTRWQQVYPPALAAEKAGRHPDALRLLQAGAAIDPGFAELHYLQGRCLAATGRTGEAQASFELARDLDTLRFRADSRLNEIVRQTARSWEGKGVFFCDTVQALQHGVPGDIPGDESFFDHVHLKFEGNYLIARAIADQLAARLPAELKRQDAGTWASASLCADRLALNPWHEYQVFENLQRRLLEPPFTNQLNHLARQDSYIRKLVELRPALRRAGVEAAAELCRGALIRSPDDPTLHEILGRLLAAMGDNQGAIAAFQRVTAYWPQHAAAYNNIGLLWLQLGDEGQAEQSFRLALARRSDFADAHNGLGAVYARQGNLPAAIAAYQQALLFNPDLVEAQTNLGQALQQQGDLQQAEAHFRAAIRVRPSFVLAQLGLADVLLRTGQPFEAITHLNQAAQAQPESALARVQQGVQKHPNDAAEYFKLASVLASLSQTNEALTNLRTTVQLNTNFWEARYLLGVELAAQDRLPEAEQQFAAVVQLRPDYARAHLNLGVALARQLRLQEAAAEFREVLRLEPTNEAAPQFLQKIQAMTEASQSAPPPPYRGPISPEPP